MTDEGWHAVITRYSRWEWHVNVTDGAIEWGTAVLGTRRRAERVARRLVAKEVRASERHAARYTVWPDSGLRPGAGGQVEPRRPVHPRLPDPSRARPRRPYPQDATDEEWKRA